MDDRVSVREFVELKGKVDAISQTVNATKDKVEHLDDCMDSVRETVMHSLKVFHSPREWLKENFWGILLVCVVLGGLMSLPIGVSAKIIGKLIGG